jgi:hypothetical protein
MVIFLKNLVLSVRLNIIKFKIKVYSNPSLQATLFNFSISIIGAGVLFVVAAFGFAYHPEPKDTTVPVESLPTPNSNNSSSELEIKDTVNKENSSYRAYFTKTLFFIGVALVVIGALGLVYCVIEETNVTGLLSSTSEKPTSSLVNEPRSSSNIISEGKQEIFEVDYRNNPSKLLPKEYEVLQDVCSHLTPEFVNNNIKVFLDERAFTAYNDISMKVHGIAITQAFDNLKFYDQFSNFFAQEHEIYDPRVVEEILNAYQDYVKILVKKGVDKFE